MQGSMQCSLDNNEARKRNTKEARSPFHLSRTAPFTFRHVPDIEDRRQDI